MRLPVKDRATQPYVSEREIPAIKAALSAWYLELLSQIEERVRKEAAR
jgi:hypothetical protein